MGGSQWKGGHVTIYWRWLRELFVVLYIEREADREGELHEEEGFETNVVALCTKLPTCWEEGCPTIMSIGQQSWCVGGLRRALPSCDWVCTRKSRARNVYKRCLENEKNWECSDGSIHDMLWRVYLFFRCGATVVCPSMIQLISLNLGWMEVLEFDTTLSSLHGWLMLLYCERVHWRHGWLSVQPHPHTHVYTRRRELNHVLCSCYTFIFIRCTNSLSILFNFLSFSFLHWSFNND